MLVLLAYTHKKYFCGCQTLITALMQSCHGNPTLAMCSIYLNSSLHKQFLEMASSLSLYSPQSCMILLTKLRCDVSIVSLQFFFLLGAFNRLCRDQFPYTKSLNSVISKQLKQSSIDQLQVQWSHGRSTIHLLIKCILSTPLPPASFKFLFIGTAWFA